MAMITYSNGRYLPHAEASVPVDDRGYQFSDGVYEVIAFFNRTLLDVNEHMNRLCKSLERLRISLPMSIAALEHVIGEVIERSYRNNGNVYLQITRGVAMRDHHFPENTPPSLVVSAFAQKIPSRSMREDGIKIILSPEERWARPDIKSLSVLPNILAKQKAVEAGAFEAWFVREDGIITECTHSNAYIVDMEGTVVIHPESTRILSGVTRSSVLKVARNTGIKVNERPFTVDELGKAKEAFLSNTTSGILSVTAVDDKPIGNGRPGLVTRKLIDCYNDYIFSETGYRA